MRRRSPQLLILKWSRKSSQLEIKVAEKTSTFRDKSIWLMICTTIVPCLYWLVKTSVFRNTNGLLFTSREGIEWQLHLCYPVTSSDFMHHTLQNLPITYSLFQDITSKSNRINVTSITHNRISLVVNLFTSYKRLYQSGWKTVDIVT